MSEGKGWIWGIVVVVVLALGGWLYYAHQRALHLAGTQLNVPSPGASGTTANAAQHYSIEHVRGIPAAASSAPLPALNDDAAIVNALAALPGGAGLRALLRPPGLIQHIVATVNALPDRSLGSDVLPVHHVKGDFLVSTSHGETTPSLANDARYVPYMQVLQAIPTSALVAWYVRFYPLFQQAYQQLGYPHGYFNDRLIVVIDNLLATPDRATLPTLVRGKNGMWDYADPALQSLSIGQRTLLRMGAADSATIKAKLRAIRADLSGKNLPSS
jgi:hypothetical protein